MNTKTYIEENAGKGAYKDVCPRCGVSKIWSNDITGAHSMHANVAICADCNVDELLNYGKLLDPERWAIVRYPNGIQEQMSLVV